MGLLERLKDGGSVLIAEGYMWELERRGYVKLGNFTPEVVLKHPEMVKMLHEEFAHAGSDVCEAYTYHGSRYKMRAIGMEHEFENINRKSLQMARQVADEFGSLMAGNVCHTWHYKPGDEEGNADIRSMFREQIEWAVDEGADYLIGETFKYLGEAMLALETIKQYGKGLPAVITLTAHMGDTTVEGIPIPKACKQLEDAGAAVVGLNCTRGPKTMLPLIKKIRNACKGPIAAIPVPYRTTDKEPTFQRLTHPDTGESVYPADVCCMLFSRKEMRQYAEEYKKIGVQYFGVCCGNSPAFMREVAEAFGRTPEASKNKPDIDNSLHAFASDPSKVAVYDWMFNKSSK